VAGVGIGTTTAPRHITEAVELLAAPAPALAEAARTAPTKSFVLLDGTPCRSTAIAADRPIHSGKHKSRVLATPPQNPLLDHPPHLPRQAVLRPHPAGSDRGWKTLPPERRRTAMSG